MNTALWPFCGHKGGVKGPGMSRKNTEEEENTITEGHGKPTQRLLLSTGLLYACSFRHTGHWLLAVYSLGLDFESKKNQALLFLKFLSYSRKGATRRKSSSREICSVRKLSLKPPDSRGNTRSSH